jgi:cytochrome P450
MPWDGSAKSLRILGRLPPTPARPGEPSRVSRSAGFGTVGVMRDRAGQYPRGAVLTLAELREDPHPALARLREVEPVSWVPVLNGWLVTRWDLAAAVMRESAAFTVDDPRFSTARVVGPSMLSLDGPGHDRHRRPFAAPFSRSGVHDQLAAFVTGEADRLASAMRTGSTGRGDLSRGLAAPLAVAVVARALGLGQVDPGLILAWYGAIVGAVSELTGGASARSARVAAGTAAFGQLSEGLAAAVGSPADGSLLAAAVQPGLSTAEIVSNAAVLMFGGIETTEGMIANAAWHLLSHRDQLDQVRAEPGLLPQAIEESLRLEPAAAVVDRYATRDVELGDARLGAAAISSGDLVSVSLAGAGRDPAVFTDPDRFDVRRDNARQNLAFARGPHFCLGVHLARLEARAALTAAFSQLPGLRLDPGHPTAPGGLVFRKPPSLPVRWDVAG